MRNPTDYKIMHVRKDTHSDLLWIKRQTGKAMTMIVADLARAARDGLQEKVASNF